MSSNKNSHVLPQTETRRLHFRKDKTNIRRLAYLALILFADPPAWPGWLAGSALIVSAVLLHGWAAGYLARAGYAEREKILTVRGPYRHNRNPYYLAHLIMDFGFFVLAGWPLFYLLYFPAIFAVYRSWVVNEETFLEREFGEDYLTFKREVPRWAFRLRPAPGRGSDLTFQWATFKQNHELPRAASHLALMAGFVLFSVFGNPLSELSTLGRFTILAAVAFWLVVRDVYPLDVSRVSGGWTIGALGGAALSIAFLVHAPLWQPFRGVGAWLAIGVGLYLGGVVSTNLYRGLAAGAEKGRGELVTRPICLWYLIGLGLGLISCTLGGVWLGIVAPFMLWILSVAGLVSVYPLPSRASAGFAVATLFVCLAAFAAVWQLDFTDAFFSALR